MQISSLTVRATPTRAGGRTNIRQQSANEAAVEERVSQPAIQPASKSIEGFVLEVIESN